MTAKEKAIEMIEDCLQIQLSSNDFENQYEMAKIQALYAANTAKWSHKITTIEHRYWELIKQEIEKL